MNKKFKILEQVLLMSTGEYYEVNLTKNFIPGIMYQVIDGIKYNINEFIGFEENACYSDVIDYWGSRLSEEDKKAYFELFDVSSLLARFEKGEEHLSHVYRTKTVLNEFMVAEHHITMYTDDETGDVMAITYLLDRTEKYMDELYKKRLEENKEELEVKLDAEKNYLDVLYRDYILAYHLNVNEEFARVLTLRKEAHAWKMPGMWQDAVFNYDKHITEFEKNFIVNGNENFLRMLSREYIALKMKSGSKFSLRMECIPNDKGNRFYEIHVVRVNPNFFDGRVIMVSQEIDDTVYAENRQQELLELERKFLNVLTKDLVAVYYVDLKENVSMLIKVEPEVDSYNAANVSLRKKNCYFKKVELYCEKFVVQEHKSEFLNQMRPDNILHELENTKKFVYRYQAKQKDGRCKYFEVQATRMGNNTENEDVLIAFRDIDGVVTTEVHHQLELEERLDREINQNEVLNALGNSFYSIFRIDLENDTYEKIRLRNAVKHFYNDEISAAATMMNMCENHVFPEYREKMKKFVDLKTLKRRMADKDAIETECITTDGNWRRVRFVAKRRDADGTLSHVLYVTQLISDEKNREEQLISIAEAAKKENEAKTEFVSKVAHDIRTPMNSLFGFLQIADANINNKEKLKYSLKKIRVAVDFLKELVNDVLDVSKMENSGLSLNPKEININELFEELPSSIQGSNFEKEIDFNFNIHDIFCDRVIGDSLRLKQIYTNILSNAVKYTPDGGRVDFEVWEEPIDENKIRLIVKISDSGIGMSEEFMEKMFVKFERATDTRLNSVSGYGLGLTIVKQLVDLMDGKIDVQSKLGEGSVFTVSLELLCADKTQKKKGLKRDYRKKCNGMHVLVAEDNLLSREVIKELLDMCGVTCDIAQDGAQCVEMFSSTEKNAYDAILLDIQMPNMSGIDAAKRIRQLNREDADSVPIIAMTANTLESDVHSYIDAGMNMHLAKPIDLNKLLRALSRVEKKRSCE